MTRAAHDIIEKLSSIGNEYRPVPFWFVNHYLREDELRRQIREMSEKGCGGIMFHGRDGLRSGYLEKEWEDGLTWSIDEAEKHGMSVWLYDENHYPSGPAGNAVFRKYPERTMMCLAVLCEETVAAGRHFSFMMPEDVSMAFAFAVSADGQSRKLDFVPDEKEFRWTNNLKESATILLLHIVREWPIPGQYFPFYPDYLDAEVSAEFIELTHQWYVNRFKEKMGITIKGMFTDNSCFNFGRVRGSVAWTPKLPERFKAETGLDLENILPGIFCPTAGSQRDRLVFWRFLGDEYLRTYVHPIKEVCERNQIASTGHYCLEDGMSEHIRQIGDRFDLKRGQTLACVDMLGHEVGEDLFAYNNGFRCAALRETADAAYYINNSRVMCECLGLLGGWKLDLGEIKRATGFLAAQGIDLFAPHGLYYSIAGARKWECTPDHLHNPMWNYYSEWTDWISKISFLMAHSDRTGKVVLLYPATTLRSHIEVGGEIEAHASIPASDRGAICDLVDFTFRTTINELVRNNIEFDIIDECLLQGAAIKSGHLVLKAANGTERELSAIILPCCKLLEKESVDTLKQFQDTGGRIITVNAHVESIFNRTKKDLHPLVAHELRQDAHFDFDAENQSQITGMITALRRFVPQQVTLSPSSCDIVSRVWIKWNHCFVMLHNATNHRCDSIHVRIECGHELFLLDFNTNALKRIAKSSGRRNEFTHSFSPAETLVLIAGDELDSTEDFMEPIPLAGAHVQIADEWEFKPFKDNVLPLREGRVVNCGAWQSHTFHFQICELPEHLKVIFDREMRKSELLCNRYSLDLKCLVNGKLVDDFRPGGYLDYFMFEADIISYARKGENEVSFEYYNMFLETDRKCHTPFIIGPFELFDNVKGGAISRPRKTIAPGDWCERGYPFYAGEAAYLQTIVLPENCRGRTLTLSLGRLSNATEVLINRQSLGRRILPPWRFDISSFACEKELELEIRILNTPQNLLCQERIPSGMFGPVEIVIGNAGTL